jgi:hypothetical protein
MEEQKRLHGRRASCITAEHTDLLAIKPKLSNFLFQPDKKNKNQK